VYSYRVDPAPQRPLTESEEGLLRLGVGGQTLIVEAELARKSLALDEALGELKVRNQMLERAQKENAVLAEALTQTRAELDTFVYSVSHDLRTPLRAMQGLGFALEEDFSNQLAPQARDYLRRIVAAAKRLDVLILDLLAYSRIGRNRDARREVDLDEIWRAVLDSLCEGSSVVSLREPLGRVWGHPFTLQQVATNLLANAVTFVAEGVEPRIEVTSRASEGRVRVCVSDNGIGIDPAHHTRIFGIFERLHGVEQYPGTGIGLAIVKKGVEGMRGTVGVESQREGGSCFWFELEQAQAS
jgi:signal transduction histidine kinase